MFAHTDIKLATWYVVLSEEKRRAHLKTVRDLPDLIPHEDLSPVLA